MDQTWCILSPEWNAVRPTSTRFVIGLQSHACSWNRFVGQVYGGWIYGGELDLVVRFHHNTNTDALQVLCLGQVTPGLSMSMRIRDM
jgi:hypothetical protein